MRKSLMALGAIALLLCTGLIACASPVLDGNYKQVNGNNVFVLAPGESGGSAKYVDGATGHAIYGTWKYVEASHTICLHLKGDDRLTTIYGEYPYNYIDDKIVIWYEGQAYERFGPGPI